MQKPPAIFLKIDQAMRSGEMDHAVTLARRALDSGHTDPVLFSLRSHWQEQNGRLEAAVADLNRALASSPHPRTLASLGRCLARLGRFADALQSLDRALALDPGLAQAHCERALVLEQSGEFRAASESYRRALVLDPANADAAAHLAGIASRRSDWDQAARLAGTALALDPHNAVARFALIARDMAKGDAVSAEALARETIALPQTIGAARAQSLNLLADALDAQDRTGDAFAAYGESNSAIRAIYGGWFAGQETGLAFARRMRTDLESLPALPPVLPAMAAPIFLMGFPRAGTTLLGQILASHRDFVTLEEKPLLIDGLGAFLTPAGGFAKLMALDEAGLEPFRAAFWQRVRQQGDNVSGRMIVDQTPLNTLYLPLIARLFPGARVIFALRDPRDVVLSCFRRLFVPNANTWEFFSLENTARFYDAAMDCAVLGRQLLPLHFHDIRNEQVVADFAGETGRLCDFLGVPFDPGMADFAERSKSRGVATPSATQVAKGLSREGIGQWRRYAGQMAPVLPLLERWVAAFDYLP